MRSVILSYRHRRHASDLGVFNIFDSFRFFQSSPTSTRTTNCASTTTCSIQGGRNFWGLVWWCLLDGRRSSRGGPSLSGQKRESIGVGAATAAVKEFKQFVVHVVQKGALGLYSESGQVCVTSVCDKCVRTKAKPACSAHDSLR